MLRKEDTCAKNILSIINIFKQHVAEDRRIHIKKRMDTNRLKLNDASNQLLKLSLERSEITTADNTSRGLLMNRMNERRKLKDGAHTEIDFCTYVEDDDDLIKLTDEVKRLPPYTTWAFLERNQRTDEEQSALIQKRICDRNGGEVPIYSDSEEEKNEEEEEEEEEEQEQEEKREFKKSEDYILRMTIEETGLSDAVLEALAQCLSRKPEEIKERYELLVKEENAVEDGGDPLFDKDLDAALDSFDTLFCRRCLVFDCKLHGCSQDLVFPAVKQFPWNNPDEENELCGPYCYKVLMSTGSTINCPILIDSDEEPVGPSRERLCQSETSSSSAVDMKMQSNFLKGSRISAPLEKAKAVRGRPRKKPLTIQLEADVDPALGTEMSVDDRPEISDCKPWRAIEKSLYQKGLEIFGRNSCLIARNVMNGMKTCVEVYQHINCSENQLPNLAGDGVNPMLEGDSNVERNETTGNEVSRKPRFARRRGRRLKFTWKSAGNNSHRKRISDKNNQVPIQFHPCVCKSSCGKECPCQVNGTCCEKYCGCPRTCRNRFRGCHCVKSQCRSRQCPCFAADRECDPDVCKNCWISCGDGGVGSPSQKGDNYECRNMKLLLKQKQRVLLGISDVSGWGVFLKNSVGKNEYIGEYTGEVLSHQDADKRGKVYDRENQSFLFNVNDELALDALRMGNKLKFANHSNDPNCYAKVMMVGGEHRVGIFSKERINAGEELFYDYHYDEDKRPDWAKKPEEAGSKKEEAGSSRGRPRKLANLKLGPSPKS